MWESQYSKNGERVAHVHNYHWSTSDDVTTMDVFDFETNDIITFKKEDDHPGSKSCDVYFEKTQHALTLTGELVL